MNCQEFREAERDIKSATGTKSTTVGWMAKWSRNKQAEREEESKKWMKSSTPYRFSFKYSDNPMNNKARSVPNLHPAIDIEKLSNWCEPRRASYVIVKKKCLNFAAVDDEAKRLSTLPLSSVLVRWQLKNTFPPYTDSELKYVLSGFGEVLSVRRLEANAAVVVFRDLLSARRAVNSKEMGKPFCRLSCQWIFPALAQPSLFAALKREPRASRHWWL